MATSTSHGVVLYKSIRGGDKIAYEGYNYNLERRSSTKTHGGVRLEDARGDFTRTWTTMSSQFLLTLHMDLIQQAHKFVNEFVGYIYIYKFVCEFVGYVYKFVYEFVGYTYIYHYCNFQFASMSEETFISR